MQCSLFLKALKSLDCPPFENAGLLSEVVEINFHPYFRWTRIFVLYVKQSLSSVRKDYENLEILII